MSDNKGVLMIYTGGTIGSMPKDPNDETSPQVVVSEKTFKELTPQITSIGYRVDFMATREVLDSCNVGPAQWQELADLIGKHYNDYEGFVILHGTDTMVYSASALSFMLANLSKPVVFTGAQRAHLFQHRNDALQNIITAIQMANPGATGIPLIPEVMILFGQDLLRGNRARKKDANGYAAYETPRYPSLAKIGANIDIDERRIRSASNKTFFVRRNLETSVIDFNIFPGVAQNAVAEKLLQDENLKGVVVRAFGAGNIPTFPDFLQHFDDASKRGVLMIDVTQCTQGRVELGLYETSNLLLAIGMVSGTDLTPEAALVKLMVALGDEDIRENPAALREFMQTDQAGEQSTTIQEVSYGTKAGSLTSAAARFRFAPDRVLVGDWTGGDLDSVQFRLYDAEVTATDEGTPIEVEIYANLSSSENPGGPGTPQYSGSARRAKTGGKTILSFDVTDATRRLFSPNQRAPFTLVLKSPSGGLSWGRAELALFIKT